MITISRRALRTAVLWRAMRAHQWAKNLLIFVPLVLGGRSTEANVWLHAIEAFGAFSLLASAVYLMNDIRDLQVDRQHWSKRRRPLASGELSVADGRKLIVICCLGAAATALIAGWGCVEILAIYLAASLVYTFWLKREPIVDVFILSALYTLRLGLGVVATNVRFSPWLFVFSIFIFLSLSLAKRQTEIARLLMRGEEFMPGRGYRASDGPLVLTMGVAAMIAAVLVLVIYLIEDAFPFGFYAHPELLWGIAVIMFLWLSRIWLLCHRGQLDDDPVAFALKDRLSLFYAAMVGAIFVAAVL
ncbi:UbiA family prenyltransferase [Methylovirgula sp. 4M-Z18]|uniref:UbiA family prenyltransferase n=1 Tax=Methylovirgula sp. 4M-Z18 TaxID=2293567 RepID=UPI000E2FAEE5|nr:UbiA family prenyltransferase [Methylovirgula sp. 4M-Z18]